MERRLLVVVDMQNDFIDGALGTKEAQAIVDGAADFIKRWEGDIVATRDTHTDSYLQTQEGMKLPVVHCIRLTDGWQLNKSINQAIAGKIIPGDGRMVTVLDKGQFGCPNLVDVIRNNGPYDDVTLIGLCTGICVVSNSLLIKAYFPEMPVSVVSGLCACVTPETHQAALTTMKMCQVDII